MVCLVCEDRAHFSFRFSAMTLQDYSYEELMAEVISRRKLRTAEQKKQKDKARYLANREDRIAYQRAYYAAHQEEIKKKRRNMLLKKHGAN